MRVDKLNDIERDFGEQPIAKIMVEYGAINFRIFTYEINPEQSEGQIRARKKGGDGCTLYF
jgi:hypothetical protein